MRAACRHSDQYKLVNICIPVPCCQNMITQLKIMRKKTFNPNLMKSFDFSDYKDSCISADELISAHDKPFEFEIFRRCFPFLRTNEIKVV